jgi:hypothetical protein
VILVFTGKRVMHGYREAVLEIVSMRLGLSFAIETELDTTKAYKGERPKALSLCPCGGKR